jgi:hypothetical protein
MLEYGGNADWYPFGYPETRHGLPCTRVLVVAMTGMHSA